MARNIEDNIELIQKAFQISLSSSLLFISNIGTISVVILPVEK